MSDFQLQTKLSNTVQSKNVDLAESIIKQGADVNFQYDNYLSDAIANRDLDMAYLLLSMGADVHRDQESALIDAVYNNDIDMVGLLMSAGARTRIDADDDSNEIVDDLETLEKLIYHVNVRISKDTPLIIATFHNNTDMMDMFIENGASLHTYRDIIPKIVAKHGLVNLLQYLDAHDALTEKTKNIILKTYNLEERKKFYNIEIIPHLQTTKLMR